MGQRVWPPRQQEPVRPSVESELPEKVGVGPVIWYGVAKTVKHGRYELWEMDTNGKTILSMHSVTTGDRNDLESVFTARIQDIFDALLSSEEEGR